jgi:2-oxoglutarate ferredoxin oxidoreductase subunit beta
MEKALEKNGFSVVEVASYCHTTFGRANNLRSPIEMMRRLKENSVTAKAAARSEAEVDEQQIVRGILHDVEKPEFTELYDEVIERAHGTLPPRKRKVRRGWA